MSRPKLFNEEEALLKAMDLFWKKGYASTSISDLMTHLGISKGSFYDTFLGKRAIFDKALDFYRTNTVHSYESLLNSEPDRKKGISKLYSLTVDAAFSGASRNGCLISNTCAELGGEDQKIKGVLHDHNQNLYDIVYGYLKEGDFDKGKDLKVITNLFLTLFTGIHVESKYKKDKSGFLNSIDLVLHLLD